MRTWNEILQELSDETDELVEDYLREFAAHGTYRAGAVNQDDLREIAHETMRLLILELARRPVPDHLRSLPQRLGARRARQGVDREALLHAVRLDFRVLWNRLERIARPDSTEVLADNVTFVLDTVESYIERVHHSFNDEDATLRRHTRHHIERMLLRLFDDGQVAEYGIDAIATGLGLPVNGRYEVLTVRGELIERMQERYALSPDVHRHESIGALSLFRQQRNVAGWLVEYAELPGGYVGGVDGLAAVPAAVRSAELIAKHAPPAHAGLATIENSWAAIAVERLRGDLPDFERVVWAPLENRPEIDRDRMLEVVRSYLETGSVKETSEALFCHRNTVINRLKLFQQLTGLDPTIPAEAAWIYVVVSGHGRA